MLQTREFNEKLNVVLLIFYFFFLMFSSLVFLCSCITNRWWMHPSESQMFQSGLKALDLTTLRTCSNTQTRTKWLFTLHVSPCYRFYSAHEV